MYWFTVLILRSQLKFTTMDSETTEIRPIGGFFTAKMTGGWLINRVRHMYIKIAWNYTTQFTLLSSGWAQSPHKRIIFSTSPLLELDFPKCRNFGQLSDILPETTQPHLLYCQQVERKVARFVCNAHTNVYCPIPNWVF